MKKLTPDKRLIVALDVPTFAEAGVYVRRLSPVVENFKVGLELFAHSGPEVIENIRSAGCNVFLDLKFFDIPNTMAGAVRSAASLHPFLLNVHALAGPEAMRECVKAAGKKKNRPKLLAVTILTSFNAAEMKKARISGPIDEAVLKLADSALKSGMDGVIASPKEAAKLRKKFGQKFLIVTPGVRPKWASKNDQKRVTTPFEAIKNGADYIVVGRPILKASDCAEAARKIIGEIEKAE